MLWQGRVISSAAWPGRLGDKEGRGRVAAAVRHFTVTLCVCRFLLHLQCANLL